MMNYQLDLLMRKINKKCITCGKPATGWEWFADDDLSNWRCNHFKYWDWGNDKDSWDDPPTIIPDDPNQLVMFTFDETIDEIFSGRIEATL